LGQHFFQRYVRSGVRNGVFFLSGPDSLEVTLGVAPQVAQFLFNRV